MRKEFLEPEMSVVYFEEEVVTSSGCPCKGQNCSGVCAGDYEDE